MKNLVFGLLMLSLCANASEVNVGGIKANIPGEWTVSGAILHSSSGEKVGEFISGEAWGFRTGDEFLKGFKEGFDDDPESTRYVSGGKSDGIYWACRYSEYESGNGEFGNWYVVRFWASGPILTLYSHDSCESRYGTGIAIAKSMSEMRTP